MGESGLAGAPTSTTSGAYIDFMKANAIGVEMKRNDWSYTSFLEAEGLKIGFHAVKSAFAEPAGSTNYPTPNGHNYGFISKTVEQVCNATIFQAMASCLPM